MVVGVVIGVVASFVFITPRLTPNSTIISAQR
jgi:hypothetical protein